MESDISLKGFPENGTKKSPSYAKESIAIKVRRYFRDYCDSSSIIGFKFLGERRSVGEKVLWAGLIIIATILSIYYILEIYHKYKENPFIVTLATRVSPIYTIPFPAVTICPVVRTRARHFNFTQVVHKIWDNDTLTDKEILNAQYMSLICKMVDQEYLDFFAKNETFDAENFLDTISFLKPNTSDTFFLCFFMGDSFPCSDFFVPIIVDEGICYTYNMLNRGDIFRDKVQHYDHYHQTHQQSIWSVDEGYPKSANRSDYPKRALLSGADHSLEIYMTQRIEDTDYLCISDAQGYSVQIHPPHSIPRMKKNFFTVPLDSSTMATVRPNLMTTSSEVKAYKIEDRQCFFTDERHLKYFKLYTLENCKMECLANYTLKTCGCVHFYLPRDNETTICGSGNIKCMENAEKKHREEELDRIISYDITSDNGCNCMPLCTELSYDAETSQTVWHWRKRFAAHRLEQRYGFYFKGFTENLHFSRLSVFFKSDQFIPSQRNELYGFFDFLSNFGGLLGLFTGFSLLSAVEIVYFISVRLWCNRRIYNDFAGSPQEEV